MLNKLQWESELAYWTEEQSDDVIALCNVTQHSVQL